VRISGSGPRSLPFFVFLNTISDEPRRFWSLRWVSPA